MAVLPVVEPRAEAPVLYPRSVARYQRIHALGEGGVGEVDLWRDQDIDRNVAVKRLKHTGTPESLAQFVQEVHASSLICCCYRYADEIISSMIAPAPHIRGYCGSQHMRGCNQEQVSLGIARYS